MTGKHGGHARIRGNRSPEVALTPDDITPAKVLKEVGYTTGVIGKWGVGPAESTGIPNRQGFDQFFGYLTQLHAHTSYPDHLWHNRQEFYLTENFAYTKKQFSNDLFTERALGFIEQNRDGPFFLYLPYTIPHANNELTRETGAGIEVPSDAPYSNRPWKQVDKNFAASITRMDRDIGRIMEKIASFGLDENTIVFFSSDNGPHHEGGQTIELFNSSGPLRGYKRDLYEGGIRVPTIARWKGHIKPAQTSDAAWAFWDFLPTAAELAGTRAPSGLDGVSIVSALEGRPLPKRDYLYWEFYERGFDQAVRTGDWKGVRRKARSAPIELYDLRSDVAEKNDIAREHPEIVQRIARMMQEAHTDSPEFPLKEKES
jgi:arylsulfatase A-like enzyme